jgi:hypothetical protein
MMSWSWLKNTPSKSLFPAKTGSVYHFHRTPLRDLNMECDHTDGAWNFVTRSKFPFPTFHVKLSVGTWHVSVLRVGYPSGSNPRRVRNRRGDTGVCGMFRLRRTRPATVAVNFEVSWSHHTVAFPERFVHGGRRRPYGDSRHTCFESPFPTA